MALFRRELSEDECEEIVRQVRDLGDDGKYDEAWVAAKPLRKALATQFVVADALCQLIDVGAFETERNIELAKELVGSYPGNLQILSDLGDAFQSFQDMRYLNAAPPEDPFLVGLGGKLHELSKRVEGDDEYKVLSGLASSARVLGRGWDETTEAAYRRLLQLQPKRWQLHYNVGLFFKTRGRFAEGQAANERALELCDEQPDNVIWNLGICATGAGDGETALRIWKGMGQKIEMGADGLPEGGYPATKVRLAQYPLAQRVPGETPNGPGQEETIWIERLSPCHGIVRSALFYDELGVDFGDVVLIDGAPVTYHKYGDDTIPVFPHLATLRKGGYSIYRFAGTQPEQGYIDRLGDELESETVVYVHSEQFRELCMSCWQSTTLDHAEHSSTPKRVVTGKVCTPPETTPAALRSELDGKFNDSDAELYLPELSRACGDSARAEIEERRRLMIEQN